MHSFKRYLLISAIYLYSSSLVYGQTQTKCGVAITPPANATVCSGTPLKATSSGTNVFLQWQKDGVNIPNPNADQRTFLLEESGSYRVIARGTTCAADTSAAVAMTVNKEEANFSIKERVAATPPSADTCGIPVKVTFTNDSSPKTGLTYLWEIVDNDDKRVSTKIVKYIKGDSTSFEPELQFYQKGQYTVRLRIKGPCFDPANPDGPADAFDPENPEAESDGRYVHEEQVIIVYPQVTPQPFNECEEPGVPYVTTGEALAQFDVNTPEPIKPGTILWKVVSGAGVTISNPTIENPTITFPEKKGSYVLSVFFENQCETSDALNKTPTLINIDFEPRPLAPNLSVKEAFVCEGGTYEIVPGPISRTRGYNFYTTPSGGQPINRGPVQSFPVGPVSGRTVYYISTVEGNCESLERSMFTVNTTGTGVTNTITSDAKPICANTKPTALTGNNATAGTNRPIYLWESKTADQTEFTPAAGTNNQQSYSPEVLIETTTFRRTVTFEGCDDPNLSNEVTIEVLPVIDPTENIIEVDKELVCRGELPTFTGNQLSGDIEYKWQSSTTSATTGFIDAAAAPGSDNTNGASFTPAFVTQPTWFRRVARYANTTCGFVASNEAILINIDEIPQAPIVAAADVTTCQGSSAVLEVQPATSGTLSYNWFTEPTGGTPIGSGSPFSTPPLTANTTFYVEAVNANECVSARRTAVRVTVAPITANAGRDTTIIQGQAFQLRASGGKTYKWTPSTNLSNDTIANPLFTAPANLADVTNFTFTVTVSSGAGCEAIDDITITVIPRIKIVNTFSPNGDGINEIWEIGNIQNFPEATVEIFNRYGAQVFKSNGYAQPWNGTHNGNPLPLATYYYIIRLNKTEKPFTGSITIIK